MPSILKAYPNRDDYLNDIFKASDAEQHLNQNGGLNINFIDYPEGQSTLLKWREVTSIQVFVPCYQGDFWPVIDLPRCNNKLAFCDILGAKLDVVKDDPIQLLELAWEYEKRRTKIITQTNNKLSKAKTNLSPNKNTEATDANLEEEQGKKDELREFEMAVKDELSDSQLQKFAYRTDILYRDAWWVHYGGFQKNKSLFWKS